MPSDLILEYVDPATLGEHPANWRRHSDHQRATFDSLLAEVGWTDPLLFNARTSRLLDGHMRRAQAIALGIPAIPVIIGDWDEPTERKILATRDTLGLMADVDPAAFRSLLEGIDTGSPELQELFSGLAESFGVIPGDDAAGDVDQADDLEADDEEAEPVEKAPDLLFPSDNPWGVPTLDVRHQADGVVFPFAVWGAIGQRKAMRGTYCFYCPDEKFAALWKDPEKVLYSGAVALVEVNYSTHPQQPRALVLADVFRKRWLARYWQSKGKKIFVDMNVAPEFRELNLLGVPRGWRSYATRSHDRGGDVEAEFAAACEHAGTEEIRWLVYGGGRDLKSLCEARGWPWFPERCELREDRVSHG
jgi:hypothetical protein